jgi:hypothetical protein
MRNGWSSANLPFLPLSQTLSLTQLPLKPSSKTTTQPATTVNTMDCQAIKCQYIISIMLSERETLKSASFCKLKSAVVIYSEGEMKKNESKYCINA